MELFGEHRVAKAIAGGAAIVALTFAPAIVAAEASVVPTGSVTTTAKTTHPPLGFDVGVLEANADNTTDSATTPGTYSDATGINDNNEVVGYGDATSQDNSEYSDMHAFLWNASDGITPAGNTVSAMVDLNPYINPDCFTCTSKAVAVNDNGDIAGNGTNANGNFAFIYTGGSDNLAPNQEITNFTAVGINPAGTEIVGQDTSDGEPAVWNTVTGQVTDLTLPAGFSTGQANAINADNQIVGEVGNGVGDGTGNEPPEEAAAWETGTTKNPTGVVNLGTLPGQTFADATDVSAKGVVSGYSYSSGSEQFAFTTALSKSSTETPGTMLNIGQTSNGSQADAIDGTEIAGITNEPSAPTPALWAYSATGSEQPTEPSGFANMFVTATGTQVSGINASRAMVGEGNLVNGNGNTEAFYYNPKQPIVTTTVKFTGGEVNLGTLQGNASNSADSTTEAGSVSYALGINSSGEVVGDGDAYAPGTEAYGSEHAWIWSVGTGVNTNGDTVSSMIDINPSINGSSCFAQCTSQAVAINDAGDIAGNGTGAEGNSFAFDYTGNNVYANPNQDEMADFIAIGINPAGTEIVGQDNRKGGSVPAVWDTATHTVTDLTLPSGFGTGSTGLANAVNADNQIVGEVENATGTASDAVVWETGTKQDPTGVVNLGTLPGGPYAEATGINANGSEVVGYGNVGGGSQEDAFTATFSKTGTQLPGPLVDIGAVSNGSQADAIYNHEVVGVTEYPASPVPAVWTGSELTTPEGINNILAPGSDTQIVDVNSSGDIVGQGILNDGNGSDEAFIYLPKEKITEVNPNPQP